MFGFQYFRLLPELKSSQWHGLTDLHDIPANGKNGFSVLEKLASHYAKNKNFLIYSRKKNTVCYYHVTQAFPSESTPYSCLNVKELLARNRPDIQSLNNSKGNKSNNHLYHKRTLSFVSSNPIAVTWGKISLKKAVLQSNMCTVWYNKWNINFITKLQICQLVY